MRSFAILRTNVGLTANVKMVINSNYNLFIESIDSVSQLSDNKLKNIQFNKENFWDELVPFLFKDFPSDIAFSIKYANDSSNMSTDFSKQYDDLYISGARNIQENKNYSEEFEYFAPLYIFKNSIPKYFVIFRVDGPGLTELNRDNFKEQFSSRFKTVKLFDLTNKTPLGEWIDRNYRNNESFPVAPLDVDFRDLEFTRWNGIDYESGGYCQKPLYLSEKLSLENTIFDLEKFFLDGFRINKVIFPNILNLNFLFDDEPATPETLRKWSINRYSGFYLDDIIHVDSITPFITPRLNDDVIISSGNLLISLLGDPFLDGFRDSVTMWVEYLGEFYKVIKFTEKSTTNLVTKRAPDKTKLLTTEELEEPEVNRYKIVSDIDLTGKQSLLNKKSYFIDSSNRIVSVDDSSPLTSIEFDLGDVYLIEIDGVFHNIIKSNGFPTLVTDYAFKFSKDNSFTYFRNSEKQGWSKSINLLITENNPPQNFKIYRVKFTDVKDFDTNIIDTQFARFEYEKRDSLTKTEEPKMYLTDLRSNSNPPDFDDFLLRGKLEFIPTSSDYTAGLETFRVEESELSEIWRKNPVYVRWGYQNSISAYDYPYLLNNNEIYGTWNLTVDTQNLKPNRVSRNLDYFYTLNSGSSSYLFHSLNIDKNRLDKQDTSYRFELDKYLELGTYSQSGVSYSYPLNYFELVFSQTASFLDSNLIENRKKYSYFERGDSVIPNTTLFRGMKFRLFEVENITLDDTNIQNINLFSSNFFENYKFSVLLSSNDWSINNENKLYKPYEWGYFGDLFSQSSNLLLSTDLSATPSVQIGDLLEIDQFLPYDFVDYGLSPLTVDSIGTTITGRIGIGLSQSWLGETSNVTSGIWRNKMQWQVIKNWEYDKSFQTGDLVFWEGVVFNVIDGSTVSNPLLNPISLTASYVSDGSVGFPQFSQFWNYNYNYDSGTISWVYNSEDFYILTNTSSNVDFWNPTLTYSISDKVIYGNRFFEALTNVPIEVRPQIQNKKIQSASSVKYWIEISEPSVKKWNRVELWDRNLTSYSIGSYVFWRDTIWESITISTVDDEPGDADLVWSRVYSFVPDTEFIYKPDNNSVIKLGDSFYYCKYNPDKTLDNGITIYINKKWKNILVNISINDNTIQSNHPTIMDETKNLTRDSLYVETNGRLTSANFIRQINDIDTLYGFSDFTSYVIIEEDGSFKKYNFNNNLGDLPYYLVCEESDSVNLRNDSLSYSSVGPDKNQLKSTRSLTNGSVDSLDKINFYNENPLGVIIENVKSEPGLTINYNSQSKEINSEIKRMSGNYMPIFYEIQLFKPYHLVTDTSVCSVTFDFNQEEIYWIVSLVGTTENLLFNIDSTNNYNQLNPTSGWWQFDSIFTDITNLINLNSDFSSTFSSNSVTIFGGSCGEQFELRLWDGSGATGPNFNVSPNPEDYPDNFIIKKDNFRPYLQKPVEENVIFDTSLNLFGVMKQRVLSKVNKEKNILKLRNNDSFNSIYPMLDEFGYMVADYFIFKSSWDYGFHIEVNLPQIQNTRNMYELRYIEQLIKKLNSN